MLKFIFLILITVVSNNSFGQTRTFWVKGHHFLISTELRKNEWDTKDTVSLLYRVEDEQEKYLLKYFNYKDEGGDCNNLFWNTEVLTIKNDSLIFEITYHQKTGIDPIPEKRKQIYKVNENGTLTLIFDKYKDKGKENWRNEY